MIQTFQAWITFIKLSNIKIAKEYILDHPRSFSVSFFSGDNDFDHNVVVSLGVIVLFTNMYVISFCKTLTSANARTHTRAHTHTHTHSHKLSL